MDIKVYAKVTALNLLLLVAGASLYPSAVYTRTAFTQVVHAQSKEKDKPLAKPEAPALDPNAEYVSPSISLGGPVVTNTLLANKIACDKFQVGGFDLLRMNDAFLNRLIQKGQLTVPEAEAIVAAGKADRPLRIKP
jgi:hypothetical protein